jgi:hypothetical protein
MTKQEEIREILIHQTNWMQNMHIDNFTVVDKIITFLDSNNVVIMSDIPTENSKQVTTNIERLI